MELKDKFKLLRLRNGWTQDELAKMLNYSSRSSISNIEHGRDLPIDVVPMIAKILGTSEAYLMGWERDPMKVDHLIKSLKDITDEQFDDIIATLDEYLKLNSQNKNNKE